MGTNFDDFKSRLKLAVQDPDHVRKNSNLQDPALMASELARIDALDESKVITQEFDDIISVLGMLVQDPATRSIKFDTRGFATTLSSLREGSVIEQPLRIWKRVVDGSLERYIIVDQEYGLFVLNEQLEILFRFPGFYDPALGVLPADKYNYPDDVVTFTIGTTEYLAVVMSTHHICKIFEYNAPHAHVATIGTLDTPGAVADELDTPVSVAVDETGELLYILCQNGQPAGATQDKGFVGIYDISVPSTPSYVDNALSYTTSGRLLDAQVDAAVDIFFDAGLLWISNGNQTLAGYAGEVGAINMASAPYTCARYIETQGATYSLVNPMQLSVQTTAGGFKKLYIANGSAGQIEVFDALTLQHENSYGYRASEDYLNNYNRPSSGIFGAIGYARGVTADTVYIDEKETNVMICLDTLNKRVHRFNLDAYTEENFANFDWLTFDTPIMLEGWSLSGTVPIDMVKVYYRFTEQQTAFQELTQDTATAPSNRVQFRVGIQLDSKRFVRDWRITKLRIHGRQG